MRKQSEAKERQQYTPKLIPGVCGNCQHYRSKVTMEEPHFSWSNPVKVEKDRRCGLGGFAVKKSGSCSEHVFSEEKT